MAFLLRKNLFALVFISLPFYLFCQGKVKMERVNGTLMMPCTVNGLKLDFIFDTGASNVTISLTEAMFMLKNDYLSKSDILDTEFYKIANGDIEEGTIVVLREIKIGGYSLYNVYASIIHKSNAPLLLGQSAISKLGKFEFDYSDNTLRFLNKPKSELIIDKRDNQYYKTVRIGNQVWMAQNLNYVTNWGSCQEENTPIIYGRLYNWKTAMKVCPEGWHLPSDNEWRELETFVKSKYPTAQSWKSGILWGVSSNFIPHKPDKLGTDDFEFSVLPCGIYAKDRIMVKGLQANFWTSTMKDEYHSLSRQFEVDIDYLRRVDNQNKEGLSVRCLRD